MATDTIVITVGDELLSGHTADVNSRFFAGHATTAGYPVRRIEIIGDEIDDIATAVRRAIGETGVARVLVGGGLGPTADDRTVAAVAQALDVPLVVSDEVLAQIRDMVRRMHQAGWTENLDVSPANHKMALIPRGAIPLENRRGMAPALACALSGEDRWMLVAPGVVREFATVVGEVLMPRFFRDGHPRAIRELRYRHIPEATLAPWMERVIQEYPTVRLGSYPQPETREVIIRLSGYDDDAVAAATARFAQLFPANPGASSP